MITQHEIEFRVRYQETDAMGMVHHSNYLTYFEMGRTEMLRAAGGDYRALEEQGLFLVVVRMTCRFHRPARFDDWLKLSTKISRITPAKIEHEYAIHLGDTLITEAESVLACVNREGQPQRIPKSMGGS